MAGKAKAVSQIKQLLRLHKQGDSIKSIARTLGIIASQLPVANWYDVIGENTIANALLDRMVHTSYRIELKGESLRKKK